MIKQITKLKNNNGLTKEGLSWWANCWIPYYKGRLPHYKGYVKNLGQIRGTTRFITDSLFRLMFITPLTTFFGNLVWKSFYAIQNNYRSWVDVNKVIDEKKDKRIADGLAAILTKQEEKAERRIKRDVSVWDLPQIGGVDSKEYDENCVLTLGKNFPKEKQMSDEQTKVEVKNDPNEECEKNPPLVVIENHPTLGVSAKYELRALKDLSPGEFRRFSEMMCGIVSQVASNNEQDE